MLPSETGASSDARRLYSGDSLLPRDDDQGDSHDVDATERDEPVRRRSSATLDSASTDPADAMHAPATDSPDPEANEAVGTGEAAEATEGPGVNHPVEQNAQAVTPPTGAELPAPTRETAQDDETRASAAHDAAETTAIPAPNGIPAAVTTADEAGATSESIPSPLADAGAPTNATAHPETHTDTSETAGTDTAAQSSAPSATSSTTPDERSADESAIAEHDSASAEDPTPPDVRSRESRDRLRFEDSRSERRERSKRSSATRYAPVIGRIPIVNVKPRIDGGEWPPVSFVTDVVPFEATVFREGHDLIGVDVLVTDPAGDTRRIRMVKGPTGTDTWLADAQMHTQGVHTFMIEAWGDDYATWRHNADIKVPQGLDVEVMLAEGAEILERAVADATRDRADRDQLREVVAILRDTDRDAEERLAAAASPEVEAELTERPVRSLTTQSDTFELVVERTRAAVGAWYEFFPRSEGAQRNLDGSWRSGTFRTAAKRLPAIRKMGFDVVYVPPVSPIGTTNRKGPNNTLTAGPYDPGSPYGVGSEDGGLDAIHPDLGDEDDFRFFVEEIKRNGMELALDIALNASPDHPWVKEHPEWFTTLPDGSIAYAENPPKKYQDIYPFNFDNDPEGIYEAMFGVFEYWMRLGVRIFRIDNPHTKPLWFWERLIHEITEIDPDAVFLSEAFTRPAMMRTLAKIGFQQSYTYFTWRNTKDELVEYLTEVSHETSDYLRPNFFVNTHDILTPYLQFGGRPAYEIRAIIAATSSPSWGVYSGYELIENVARPGAEENIDNEKYEFKPRDWEEAERSGQSIAPLITKLNEIRAAHPALRQLRNFQAHWSSDDSVLVFSKHLDAEYTEDGKDDTIIVVVNVDPHSVREARAYLDPTLFGVDPEKPFEVEDLLTGETFWWGQDNYVRLDAFSRPAHVLTVRNSQEA